ncbi:M23 family metallopeptidase [Chryseobacterium wangxinyae]|uniref:M23 family metallopeptidase n=1 Tax=Chryseobacterium sp. CY353 TaxID=2997334 RepID=UPI002D1E368D|nr:M23 family metallopeptidase [Chryseobacterium sp. CY353]
MLQRLILSFITIFSFALYESQIFPTQRLEQFTLEKIEQNYKNDTLFLRIENPLFCPLRFRVFSNYLKDENIIDDTLKVTIKEKSFAEFKIFAKDIDVNKVNFRFDGLLGDESRKIMSTNLALPFVKGKRYLIMQGQKGNLSHNDNYSRYAIDFSMPVGETVVAADDGYVVGVIKDYEFGGNDRKWIPYANFITIYHPESGLFTQYVHLKHNGSSVKVGDAVKKNQPIGLSGITGYTTAAHLHFNVLVPKKGKSLVSVPFVFEKNIKGEDLRENMSVKK